MHKNNKIVSIFISMMACIMLCASLTLHLPDAREGIESVITAMDSTNAQLAGMPNKPMNDDDNKDESLIEWKK